MIAQRNPNSPRVLSVRPLVPADLEALRQHSAVPRLKNIRDAHHNVARLLASGLKQIEVAAQTGYSVQRIWMLSRDPSVRELVAHYRAEVTESWRETVDAYHSVGYANMLKAERQISEHIDRADEEGELLPVRDLIAISRDAADRFGYGKKSMNVNLNVDFAARLEAAISKTKSLERTDT